MSDNHSPRRLRVVRAWQAMKEKFPAAPLGPECIHAICKQLKERSRFVQQWLQRWLSSPRDAALRSLPSSGRPRKAAYQEVAELVHDPRAKSSLRAAAERSQSSFGIRLSKNTIGRAAHAMGWHKHKATKGKMLSGDMIATRKQWAKDHASQPWCSTLMLDSTVITYCPPLTPAYGQWGPPYEHFEQHQLGSQLHLYAGASLCGLSALHECTGSTGVNLAYTYKSGERQGQRRDGVGADEAKDVLAAIIKETAPPLLELGRPGMRVMLDRAAPHTSNKVQNYLHKNGFHDNLLHAPGCDINWMDWAVWPQLKQRVYARQGQYRNFQQFRLVVHEEWRKTLNSCRWGWLAARQSKRVAMIGRDGKLLH